jgi:hypothetical protein
VARTTAAGAKAEVAAALTAAAATFGSADVFAYQPQIAELDNGLGVAVFTAGITPDFWQIGVRVIITATVSQQTSQDALDTYTLAVDAALSSRYGPSNWVFEFPSEDAPWYAATNVLQVGREDY